MFGSAILETAIGLVFIYLVLSIIGTATVEVLSAAINCRGAYLKRWVDEMLGRETADKFYQHPLISGLIKPSLLTRLSYPSYIPEDTFAEALVYFLAGGQYTTNPADASRGSRELAVSQKIEVASVIPLLEQKAAGDITVFLTLVKQWYSASQNRVQGRFKVTTIAWLLSIGFFLSLGCNIDTIQIVNTLYSQTKLRQDIAVSSAKLPNQESQVGLPEMKNLEDAGLIGWSTKDFHDYWSPRNTKIVERIIKILGCLMTTLAMSLGAPYWFEILNKLNQAIRSTGVKPNSQSTT